MRILFFSHYFPPEGNAPATRTFENTRRWVRAGHQVGVVTCTPNVPNGVVYEGYKNGWHVRESIEGIDVRRVWSYLAPNKGTQKRILNYVSYMATAVWRAMSMPRPDCIIATSPQFFCGWAGVITSRLRRCPFILEIRDIWPESIEAVEAMKGKWVFRFLEMLEGQMYRSATHIVCVGPGYRRKLLEKGVPAEKISIVMNGTEDAAAPEVETVATIRQQYALEGKFVAAYVGTIGMACGLSVVLRAAEQLRAAGDDRVRFLIVGDGAVREELELEAKQKGLKSVVFTGRVDKKLVQAFLGASDVAFIHLKRSELFKTVIPSKMFDAFAASKPIVMGVEGDAAELLRESGGGYAVQPESERELLRALHSLMESPAAAKAMGERGRVFARARFDRDCLARTYMEQIQNVVPALSRHTALSRPTTARS